MALASEKVVLSSPMSFSGSATRIWKLTDTDKQVLKWLLLIPLAVTLIFFAWSGIFIWYCIFGLWVIPWRLFRRSQRKGKKQSLQHQEVMEALARKK